MAKTILIIILILVAVLLLLTFFIGFGLSYYLVHPRLISLERAEECENSKGYWRDFGEMEKESYSIFMKDGYEIHSMLVPAKEKSKKYVIITHGYTYNRYGSVKYVHLFRDLGYNCVIYDDRGHGLNEKTVCTMGLVEHKDLLEVIEDTYERYGRDIFLGLHGESMGSAMTVLALGAKPNVKFAVIDCGYADLMSVAKHKVKQLFHLPGFVCYPADLICKLFYGYRITKVRPIDALKENQIPLCFMHGEADDFIHYSHSIRMNEAAGEWSQVHLFPGADHAESFNSDEMRYRNIVKEFLEKRYE